MHLISKLLLRKAKEEKESEDAACGRNARRDDRRHLTFAISPRSLEGKNPNKRKTSTLTFLVFVSGVMQSSESLSRSRER